jgi:hypothetical protein
LIVNEPLARHYLNRVEKRMKRILNGEYIGAMIDSDEENLLVDEDFED